MDTAERRATVFSQNNPHYDLDMKLNRAYHFELENSDPKTERGKPGGGKKMLVFIVLYLILLTALDSFLLYKVFTLQSEQRHTAHGSTAAEQASALVHELPNVGQDRLPSPRNSSLEAASLRDGLGVLEARVDALCGEGPGGLGQLRAELGAVNASTARLQHSLLDLDRKPGIPETSVIVECKCKSPPGPQGPKGDSGPKGSKGDQGSQGLPGLQGVAGAQAEKGEPGEAGGEGPRGAKGEKGELGPIGSPGPTGSEGPPGDTGSKGDPGEQGVPGSPGAPGLKGDTGSTGFPGPVGEKGDQGSHGIPGQPGEPGSPGPMGSKGETGIPGTEGLTGVPGVPGVKGEQGLKGDAGPQGQQGLPGIQGPPGQKGDVGQTGLKGDTGSPGDTGTPGEQGVPGENGTQGDRGPQGDRGEPGPQGPRGEKGASSQTASPVVRIAGGGTRGRVEVFYKGEWGTVCDDDFGNQDGTVICRMLGYTRATSIFTAPPGDGKIWLDDLGCTGRESSVFLCPHSGLGTHNCNHDEDVGVSCV